MVDTVLRITRGHADADELAAVTVVLLAALGGVTEEDPDGFDPLADPPNWKRPERRASYQAPHSWM
jgi:hypothetical protein